MPNTFAITRLHIIENEDWNEDILKVLKQGETYWFNQYGKEDNVVPDNFFAKNLTISTIVGKNGSGKSSLIELIYRMLNNFGVRLNKCSNQPLYDNNLLYVPRIYADLYYMVKKGNVWKGHVLHCHGQRVTLEVNNTIHYFEPKDDKEVFRGKSTKAKWHWEEDMKELSKISSDLFYTIGINYSMQSMIAEDYANEAEISNTSASKTWIDGAFHKNDGYRTPLTLCPYRDNGQVDMSNISSLVKDYLVSILSFNQSQRKFNEFLPGYATSAITYRKNCDWLVERCMKYSDYEGKDIDDFYIHWWNQTKKKENLAWVVLDELGVDLGDNQQIWSKLQPYLCLYLMYKLISVAKTYANYKKYRLLVNYENLLTYPRAIDKQKQIDMWRDLTRQILEDNSHVTYKIRQTCYLLLCICHAQTEEEKRNVDVMLESEFELTKYQKITGDLWKNVPNAMQRSIVKINGFQMDNIIETLPPPIFNSEVELLRKKDGESIPLKKLSSGERQYLHSLATVIYHINNLRSVQPDQSRMYYRMINIVFDEAEICFHPEMQREFVNNLVAYLSQTGLVRIHSFHIFILTHSPFILSDIPQSNILYLGEDGRPDTSEKVKTFGANVNDLLAQSFFLNKGFSGLFAQNKIRRTIDFLTSKSKEPKNQQEKMEAARVLIEEIIGEPILKELMRRYCNAKNPSR